MKRIIKCCLTVALGFAVAGCSEDGGHKKVQLWKYGPYWAETNVGAEMPWESGYYFWWGDTIGYKYEDGKWVASDWPSVTGDWSSSSFSFESRHVPTCDKEESDLRHEGWITADGVLAPKHDAAHAHWGGKWRMPTKQELDELCNKCDWEWTTLNGVSGYFVRGRNDYASASIFLPCAGEGNETSLRAAGSCGYYWSSVRPSDDRYNRACHAWGLYFGSSDRSTYRSTSGSYRGNGQSVRPVQEGFTQ